MSNVPLIMTPAGHPSVSEAFLDELENFDRHIKLSFSEYKVSKLTTQPLISDVTGKPFYHPRWTVWFFDEERNRPVFMFEWERDGEYAEPDRGIIEKIRSDLIRQGFSMDWIVNRIMENKEDAKQRKQERYDDLKEDFFKENEKYFEDATDGVLEEKKLYKDEKIYSYEGQTNRSSNTDPIKKTDKEVGLVKVDWDKEMKD